PERPGEAVTLLDSPPPLVASRQSRDAPRFLLRHVRGQAAETRLPLDGQERLLARVAVRARGHDVAPHGGAAAAERHQVIHRQRLRSDAAPAVVADSIGHAALPPLAGPQLARLRALASQLVGIDGGVELSHGPRARWTAPPTRA